MITEKELRSITGRLHTWLEERNLLNQYKLSSGFKDNKIDVIHHVTSEIEEALDALVELDTDGVIDGIADAIVFMINGEIQQGYYVDVEGILDYMEQFKMTKEESVHSGLMKILMLLTENHEDRVERAIAHSLLMLESTTGNAVCIMDEVIKEIRSRKGRWNPKTHKYEKELTGDEYKANFENCTTVGAKLMTVRKLLEPFGVLFDTNEIYGELKELIEYNPTGDDYIVDYEDYEIVINFDIGSISVCYTIKD